MARRRPSPIPPPRSGCASRGPTRSAAQLEKATAGQRIANHPIQVRRFDRADQAAGCHVVYLASADGPAVNRALQGLRGKPVLTVTDAAFEDTARGIVHFVVRDNRSGSRSTPRRPRAPA